MKVGDILQHGLQQKSKHKQFQIRDEARWKQIHLPELCYHPLCMTKGQPCHKSMLLFLAETSQTFERNLYQTHQDLICLTKTRHTLFQTCRLNRQMNLTRWTQFRRLLHTNTIQRLSCHVCPQMLIFLLHRVRTVTGCCQPLRFLRLKLQEARRRLRRLHLVHKIEIRRKLLPH